MGFSSSLSLAVEKLTQLSSLLDLQMLKSEHLRCLNVQKALKMLRKFGTLKNVMRASGDRQGHSEMGQTYF